MNLFDFLVKQEQTLRDMIEIDFEINSTNIIVYVAPNPRHTPKFIGVFSFKDHRIEVVSDAVPETMVKLCIKYGELREYYLSECSG